MARYCGEENKNKLKKKKKKKKNWMKPVLVPV